MCCSDASASPVKTASKEQQACQDLAEKILSGRLWLTDVSSVAEVWMPRSCCQFRMAAEWACVLLTLLIEIGGFVGYPRNVFSLEKYSDESENLECSAEDT